MHYMNICLSLPKVCSFNSIKLFISIKNLSKKTTTTVFISPPKETRIRFSHSRRDATQRHSSQVDCCLMGKEKHPNNNCYRNNNLKQ